MEIPHMLRNGSRFRLALGAAGCLVFLSGCAGVGNERLAFWPGKKPATVADSPVLDSRQTADVQLALGRTAEQQQQWSAAMTIYRQLLDADPKHPEATHRLAILHDRKGDYEQSSQWFTKARALKPGDPDLLCDIGFSLYTQRRYAEAEINFRQAIAVNPDHARSQNHLGLVLAQQGDREAALVAFRRANCSPAQAHTNLAVMLALNNHVEDASEHLVSARRDLAPKDLGNQKRLSELEVLMANHESRQVPAAGSAEVHLTALPPAP